MNLRDKLRENLRNARIESDITQANLGDAIGVCASQVNKWENGKSVPEIDRVEEIARYYGKDPSWFFQDNSKAWVRLPIKWFNVLRNLYLTLRTVNPSMEPLPEYLSPGTTDLKTMLEVGKDYSLYRPTVSTNIRSARIKRGLKQEDLARAVGTSWQKVSRWESGQSQPLFPEMEKLAAFLGVDPIWFMLEHEGVSYPPGCQFAEVRDGALIQFQNWHDLTNHVHPLVVTSPPPEDMPGTQLATVSSPIDPHSSWVECFSLPCVASAFAV